MSVSQYLSCHFKSVCHPTLSLMPSVCYRLWNSPVLAITPSVFPLALSVTMSADTPQPHSYLWSSFLQRDSAWLCIYSMCVYPPHPALLCRVSCLSQLSAHTGDLLLFLEQRMKKSQSDRKYARMKTFKNLLIPVLLTFCPSFTPCASYLWFPAFVFLSSVISCPLTNALRWCIFVVCPFRLSTKGGHKLIDNYTYSSTSFDFLHHLHQSLSRCRSLSLDPGCELSGGFQLCSGRPDLPGVHG